MVVYQLYILCQYILPLSFCLYHVCFPFFPGDSSMSVWCHAVRSCGVSQGCISCCALVFAFLSVTDRKEEFPTFLILLKSVLQSSELESVSLSVYHNQEQTHCKGIQRHSEVAWICQVPDLL